ncbi:major facilitator superfamily transporter [Tritrichomonas foetus]|uniref:Major facilitator superfamily transporter n=1 Tax=Tritrichomonas foetus TaxID=1144522 RepID=A0A1J4K6G0_9EUKA|nr:major facilitator superfamily transporter [Tritrichomonas foetus]|eukprot:OHT05294.1 major facilitator superfamily transporter [Tritrichomonas foetus]
MSSSMIDSINDEKLLVSSTDTPKSKTFYIAFFITLPVFMGYACCFALQRNLSLVFGLTEGVSGTTLSKVYGYGVSFVYFFNLIFRVFGHNLVFGCLTPRNRIIAALVSNIIGMVLLSILSYQKTPPHVAWVFICYSFVGVCEGSFGPNMLSIANSFGDTRLYVILAMPAGVATITLLGFFLMAFGVPFQCFYIATAIAATLAIFIYLFTIYPAAKLVEADHPKFDLHAFWADLKEIGNWFPKIWVHSLVFLINMVCLSMFNPGCILYAYSSRVNFKLFGFTVSHDWFIFIYNCGGFLGDFISRRVMDKKKIIHPLFFFLLLVFAFGINISLTPEIAPLAAFLFNWANGGLYCQSTKLIGQIFKDQYCLTATSTWLFIGDVGSTSGSSIIQYVRSAIDVLKSRMY